MNSPAKALSTLPGWQKVALLTSIVVLIAAAILVSNASTAADENKSSTDNKNTKPALTVTAIKPTASQIAATFNASGNIAAWQEAIVGAEVAGLRIDEVRANVGDVVKKGQVLATFAPEQVEAEMAQSRASVAEAEAALGEAQGNADRAKTLEKTGAMSSQQINQYLTAAKTAEARLASARAMARVSQVRLTNTQVVAADDGTISARLATVGAVVQSGQELFRLVRKNRLEWRAEVTSSELAKISKGQKVVVMTPSGDTVDGTVRMIAPTVDPVTRNVQVYVDLAPGRHAKAGMFARGEFVLAKTNGLTVPPQAVVMRDGFAYVFVINPDNRVQQVKVQAGRRFPDSVEIRDGVKADSVIVAQGAGFLNDGDLVKVVAATDATAKQSPAKK